MDNEELKFEKIDVDMTAFLSDEAKALRRKIKSCQDQMDYLAFKYNLYVKKQDGFRKDYQKLLGVEEDGKPVQ